MKDHQRENRTEPCTAMQQRAPRKNSSVETRAAAGSKRLFGRSLGTSGSDAAGCIGAGRLHLHRGAAKDAGEIRKTTAVIAPPPPLCGIVFFSFFFFFFFLNKTGFPGRSGCFIAVKWCFCFGQIPFSEPF